MKRIIIVITILIIIIAAGLFITRLGCSTRSFDDLHQEMQFLISDLVENDKSVRNCVLAVMKGDGSFSWSGAAGIARQDGQVLMRKDTPIYIASITKLYTATAIMRLYEKGALSLDDTMSKYLPKELIEGIHVYKGKDYSQEITIRELSERVIKLTGSSSIIQYIPYDEAYAPGFEDMRRRIPDLHKLHNLTGYRPSCSLDDTLNRVIAYEVEHLGSE